MSATLCLPVWAMESFSGVNEARCQLLLQNFSQNKVVDEKGGLESFDSTKLKDFEFIRGTAGVFRVLDESGRTFYLRIGNHYSDPQREAFASNFVRQAPDGITPLVRVLDKVESKNIFMELLDDVPEDKRGDLEDSFLYSPGRISVAMAYPGRQLAQHVENNQIKNFGELSLEEQRKVSDRTVLFTLLGIPDAHGGNMLHHKGEVVAIDLAHKPYKARVDDDPLLLEHQQVLFDNNAEGGMSIFDYAQKTSPELRAWIQSVTKTDFMHLARESGYIPKPGEWEAFRKRQLRLQELWSQ